jgi:hypothetical protein
LRNPFLSRLYFTGDFATFFARGSATITLLTAKPIVIFEASRESESNPSFHFTK